MVEFICNLILILIPIICFIMIIYMLINTYNQNKKYKKFIEDIKIGDKFYAGTLTYNNPFENKEDEDIFFEIIDLKYNQCNELYTKVKWSDNNISVISGDKLYWEYTKI